jgi:large subunit ribosomal protein L3
VIKAVLGRKLGMSHIFDESGAMVPVTLVEVTPNVVTALKSKEKDGYEAAQIGFGSKKRTTKSISGHLKKAGVSSVARLAEVRVKELPGLGDKSDASAFVSGDLVTVTATGKGKGFQGVIKRHGFGRAPESHGHDHQRQPGAIGSQAPQRVILGKKLPGRMGTERSTIKNLKIIVVDPVKNLLGIRGSIPGPNKGIVLVRGQE